MPSRHRRILLAAVAALAVAPATAQATAQVTAHVPGEVIVTYRKTADRADRSRVQRQTDVGHGQVIGARTRLLRVRDGASVAEKVRELRGRPEVRAAAPNAVARVSWIPRDPGRAGIARAWRRVQWNFAGRYGVRAPDAWQHLINAGHPGGRGTVVAVLDTGVAYANRGRFRRSPDFSSGDFIRGYDFVDHDRYPNDENGHGTHVAGTIGESTDNDVGVTGLAYGAQIMPVRVLDDFGEGDSVTISKGIRYAVTHGADVINLSFEFDRHTRSTDVPEVVSAVRYANREGVLVVGASGNSGARRIAYPAKEPTVLSVGGITEHGCEAKYSNSDASLDVVAPGGGTDRTLRGDGKCRPDGRRGRDIVQMTYAGSVQRFGLPADFRGTSMAAPHVSATAALVIASGVLGPDPSPAAIENRLKATARPLGPATSYGAGLIDAAAATAPPPAPTPTPIP